jgi:diaminopimelate epimerase
MTAIPFAKYHGLGNDFLIVDLRNASDARAAAVQDPAVVRALCDRQFGVGGDGVLALLAPITSGAFARMRVLNADGSEAEMCGNGIRCVASYLAARAGTGPEPVIDTGAGPLRCAVAHRHGATVVTVDMGRPRLTRAEIPMTGDRGGERCIEEPLTIGEAALRITAVSMGNPHAVAFVDDRWDALRERAERLGPAIERHAWFPNRTNAEFARQVSRDRIDLVVWERGCGITLACGTGACATAVAACLTDRATPGHEIAVRVLGGELAITVDPAYATVAMRGPAAHVFDAQFEVAALLAAARPA